MGKLNYTATSSRSADPVMANSSRITAAAAS
jgi:hypothetical protein